MALNTLPAGAFADDAITSDKINLANTFAFTGTVTGTSSDMVKISTTTISSAVATVEFTNLDNSTYPVHVVHMQNVELVSNNKELCCQVGTDSAFVTTNYRTTGVAGRAGSTTVDGVNNHTVSEIKLNGTFTQGQASYGNFSGFIFFYNMADTDTYSTNYLVHGSFPQDSAYVVHTNLSGRNGNGEAHTKVRFGNLTSDSNMSSGKFTLYGMKA